MSDEDLDKNILSAFSNKNASKKPRKRTMKDDDDEDEDSYGTSEDIDIEDGAMDDDDDTDDTDDDRSSAPKKRGPAKKKGRARDFSDDDDDDDSEDDDDDDLDIMEDRASEKRGQKTKAAKGAAGKKAPPAAKKGRQASAAAPAKGRGKKAPVPFQSLSLAKDLAFITAEGLKYGIEFESLPYGPDNYIDYNERERLTREMPQIELESMLYERSEEQNQIRIRNDIKFQQLKDLKAKEMAEDKKTTSTEKPRRSTRQTASQKKPRRSLASRKAALSGDESESDSYDDSDGSVSDSTSDRDDDSDDYHDRTMDSIDSDLSFGATPAKSSRKTYDPRSATSSSSTLSSQAEKEPVVEEDPTKVTVKDVRKVQILRSDLEYFFDKPNMKECLQNSYVRLMIGTKKDNEKVYRMCEIIGIRESKDKKYKFFNTETNIYLTLRHARDSKDFSMDVVSNQPITEEEFNRWWSNLGEYDLVTKQTILQKVEELEKFKTEIKEDLNSFQRMTELRCQIKIAVDAENEPEIARLRDLIDALDQKIKQRNLKPRRKLKASSNSNGLSSLDLSQVHASRASADFVVPRSSGPPAHKLFNSNFDFDLRINTDLDHSLLSETEAQKLDRLAKSIKFFDAKRPYNVMSSNEYFDRF